MVERPDTSHMGQYFGLQNLNGSWFIVLAAPRGNAAWTERAFSMRRLAMRFAVRRGFVHLTDDPAALCKVEVLHGPVLRKWHAYTVERTPGLWSACVVSPIWYKGWNPLDLSIVTCGGLEGRGRARATIQRLGYEFAE